jgi:hypothetical protein
LAIPPGVYETVIEHLGQGGLASAEAPAWRRVIIEKPFGTDLASARKLNAVVHQHFDEDQVFRIDHYLGKETVQNLLVFRFGNGMYEPVWNRRYIDHVQITAAETVGVERRAAYYEGAGALRDMVQNHMMQLLAMVAMEPPSAFNAESVRDRKMETLSSPELGAAAFSTVMMGVQSYRKGLALFWDKEGRKHPDMILCPHEVVAVHMAGGYALATGKGQAVFVHVDAGTAKGGRRHDRKGQVDGTRRSTPSPALGRPAAARRAGARRDHWPESAVAGRATVGTR